MAYLLGIDAGTSSLKVALFDDSGQVIFDSDEEYELLQPQTDQVELDVRVYWATCARGIQHVLQQSGIDKKDRVRFFQSQAGGSRDERKIGERTQNERR